MTIQTEDTPIATVPKNAREEFRIQLRTFNDRRFADIRVFAENGKGKLVATPKGVAIKPETLGAVIRALQEAEQAAKKEGLIGG